MAERGARSVGAAVAVAAMALGGVCAPGALAADSDLEWYINDTGVRDAWSEGLDGSGVKVAVIDSAVVSDHPSLADADISYDIAFADDDAHTSCTVTTYLQTKVQLSKEQPFIARGQVDGMVSSHGTQMVAMIVGNGKGYDGGAGIQGVAPKASVQAWAYTVDDDNPSGLTNWCTDDGPFGPTVVDAFTQAVDSGARIVNMSLVSDATPSTDVYIKALRRGLVMVAGRANSTDPGANDMVGEPSKLTYMPGMVVTNAVDRDGNLQSVSDVKDGNVAIVAPGVGVTGYRTYTARQVSGADGTSKSTALVSGYLALVMQKWPKATGNQVLQSLVRNTKDNDTGEAQLDPEHKTGFGQIDLAKLLKTDPSQYPDINPLLAEAVERSDQHEETKGMYTSRDSWDPNNTYGKTDPFPYSIEVTRDDSKINDEYQRQKAAWKQVEQCRKDGAKDCMQYSATANADRDEPLTYKSSSNAALWVGIAAAVAVAAVVEAVFVVRSRKHKTGKA
ncbi:MAG: S8/S53 family peptidase [Bifidobacterium sp.]|nr:S8/S53 family peptidase [Bifidobacterium sp.]